MKEDLSVTVHSIDRDVWLYLLSIIDLSEKDYWYLRGMLDVSLPPENNAKCFTSPIISYLYKIIASKNVSDSDVFCYEDNFSNHKFGRKD